jgi:hypothetical protein
MRIVRTRVKHTCPIQGISRPHLIETRICEETFFPAQITAISGINRRELYPDSIARANGA